MIDLIQVSGKTYKTFENEFFQLINTDLKTSINEPDLFIGLYGDETPESATQKLLILFGYEGDEVQSRTDLYHDFKIGFALFSAYSDGRDKHLEITDKLKNYLRDNFSYDSLEVQGGYDEEKKQYVFDMIITGKIITERPLR